jgi:hypothetical protein
VSAAIVVTNIACFDGGMDVEISILVRDVPAHIDKCPIPSFHVPMLKGKLAKSLRANSSSSESISMATVIPLDHLENSFLNIRL